MDWQKKIKKLSIDELQQLFDMVYAELQDRKKPKEKQSFEYKLKNPPSYVQEYMKCGKPACKCASGKKKDMHGPYWMEVRRINGKLKTRYIGKKLKVGINKSEDFLGAIFEFEHDNMEVEGFFDDGIAFRGPITVTKKDKAYPQLMKIYKLLKKEQYSNNFDKKRDSI